jgi:hypothetical protein
VEITLGTTTTGPPKDQVIALATAARRGTGLSLASRLPTDV